MDFAEVTQKMESMAKLVEEKLSEFQAELSQASRKQPNTISALNGEFQAFKSFVTNSIGLLRAQVNALAQGQDRIEMRSRRKMLLVHGVSEDKKEDTTAKVVSLLSTKFSAVEQSPTCVRTSHRMGSIKSIKPDKPRPILVKFSDQSVRDGIWFAKKVLKGSGITLSEFLTKPRHDTFMAAREKVGVTNCWTRGGWIHLKTPDGKKHKVSTMTELNAVLDN